MKNNILILTLSTFLLLSTSKVLMANEIQTEAKYAFMQDFTTGEVLYNKNGEDKMYPASMTKLMLLYIVFEMIKDERLSLDDEIKVSANAWEKGGIKSGSSTMFLEPNTTVKLKDLLSGIIIQSGNDACIAIAEHISGTEESFAALMNDTAKKIGLENSHFLNVTGWPNENHYMSAKDLVHLSSLIIKDFPEHYKIFSEKEFTYNKITQENRNPLLYILRGADGIKTGHTEESGFGLASSAKRDGRRIVLVVNGLKNNKERGVESVKLLEWGFREFNNYELFKKDTIIEEALIWQGKKDKIPLLIKEDIILTLRPLEFKNMIVKTVYESPLQAPIQKGTEVAKLEIYKTKDAVSPEHTFPLIAGESVAKVGIFGKMIKNIQYLIKGLK